MVTLVFAETAVVVITKGSDTVAPAGTVTVGGTVAAAVFELARATVVAVATALRMITVFKVDCPPPITVDGERVNAETEAGVTASVSDFTTVP
jgi:hypothetical protein